jgi:hypothetical protein
MCPLKGVGRALAIKENIRATDVRKSRHDPPMRAAVGRALKRMFIRAYGRIGWRSASADPSANPKLQAI